MTLHTFDAFIRPDSSDKHSIAKFLYEHLDNYGDTLSAINKCIDYAIKEKPAFGGFILAMKEENEVIGAVIVNRTGMEEYIPENILVYIATHKDHRGKGVGKQLMKATMDKCEGSIALHVEPDNPAKHLYEKMGFENKYLEMRLTRK